MLININKIPNQISKKLFGLLSSDRPRENNIILSNVNGLEFYSLGVLLNCKLILNARKMKEITKYVKCKKTVCYSIRNTKKCYIISNGEI